jgi:replication factor C small subunit
MYSEVYRPNVFNEVIGHTEAKGILETYLKSNFARAVFLTGPPGIGKTTLALCAARTFEFEPLEINASRSIRSFEDVEKIKDACRSTVSIQSFLRGETKRKMCVILTK